MDLILVIKAIGLFGIFAIVFAESGLFFGFFLPGDSLLFSAGLIASQGYFNVWVLIVICSIGAITGDSVGYWMGKKMGRKLFDRDAGIFFRRSRVRAAEEFYARHGIYTIILARFVPIVRTFAPIVAGIGEMKYKTFLTYNIIGGVLWTSLILLGGYYLGKQIPNPDVYILPVIVGIIIVSLLPFILKLISALVRNKK